MPSKQQKTYRFGAYSNAYGQTYFGEINSNNIFALDILKSGIHIRFRKIAAGGF